MIQNASCAAKSFFPACGSADGLGASWDTFLQVGGVPTFPFHNNMDKVPRAIALHGCDGFAVCSFLRLGKMPCACLPCSPSHIFHRDCLKQCLKSRASPGQCTFAASSLSLALTEALLIRDGTEAQVALCAGAGQFSCSALARLISTLSLSFAGVSFRTAQCKTCLWPHP